MAKQSWASVQLLVGSKCASEGAESRLAGEGLSYFSADDYLTFVGFWPWSDHLYSSLIEYDAKGMIKDVRPCPNALSSEQIREMRVVATEILAGARTAAEKRMLSRVGQRLAVVDGAKLASGQAGCTDAPIDRMRRPERQDAWDGFLPRV
jgi:hypothetical protein